MFSPLAMGTNHMLGIDTFVPLTVNNFEVRVYNMDGNGLIKFPSKVQFQDVEWTLNCYCQPNVLESLRAWRKLVYDPDTERMGLPSEYMKQVFFIKYDGQGNVRDVIRCPGTWIGALDNGAMNQTGGELVKIKVPFIISRVIYMSQSDIQK